MSANPKPFLFNTSFDPPTKEEIAAARQAELDREHQEEERLKALEAAEEAPSFSEEELEAAKQESYDQGRQEAIREMEVHAEQILAVTQQSVATKLEQIFLLQEQAAHVAERNTLELANVIVRKLFPALAVEHGPPEIFAVVRNTLEQFREEPAVTIRVHTDYEPPMSKATQEMADRGLFKGSVHVIGDPEISPGDCRIEWDGGGAERNMDRLWGEIDGIIEKTMGMMDQFEGPYEPLERPDPTPPPQPQGQGQAEKQQSAAAPADDIDAADNIDLFGDDEEPASPAQDTPAEQEALPDNIELFGEEDETASTEETSPEIPENDHAMESVDDQAEAEMAERQHPAMERQTTEAAPETEPETTASNPSGVENG